MSKENIFPDTLMIRDTQIHDDLGGAGQRIYTTAGQGYEKKKYIRSDIVEKMLAEQRKEIDELRDLAIWMTGLYPFADLKYFRDHRHILAEKSDE